MKYLTAVLAFFGALFFCSSANAVPAAGVKAFNLPENCVPANVLYFNRGDFLTYEQIFGNVFKGSSEIRCRDRYLISQRGALTYKDRTGTLEFMLLALKKSAGTKLKRIVLHFDPETIGGNAKNYWKTDLDEMILRFSRDEKIEVVIGETIDEFTHARSISGNNGSRVTIDPGLTSLHDNNKIDFRDKNNLAKRPIFRDGFVVYQIPAAGKKK